jgi:hypothetical protein
MILAYTPGAQEAVPMYYANPPAEPPVPSPGGGAGAPPGWVPPGQGLAPVLVAFGPSAPQSRGTVAIRILLAIPHLIVLYAIGIAAEVVLVIGWFAALFTGRLPDFAAEFLAGYLRWQTRVYGYVTLLTDAYPPFALSDAPYPIRVATLPGRLNRLAVLFRLILVVPASIVIAALSFGAFSVTLFVTWLIVLISGRMPDTLHQALAAALRYYTRTGGYIMMLTSAYPGGLFGDRPAGPAYDPAAFPPMPNLTPPPDPWTLTLSSAARKLVGLFLVLGAVLYLGLIGGTVALVAGVGNTVSRQIALDDLGDAVGPVNTAEESASTATQGCGQNLACVTSIDAGLAGVYRTFASQVASIPMPDAADSATAATIASDASNLAGVYAKLGQATTASQYLSIVNSSDVQGHVSALSTDFGTLRTALGGS